MICKYCDQRIPNDSEYCPFCGSKIASANLRNKKGSNIVAPSSKAKRNSKKSTPIKTIIAGLFILLVLRSCFSSDNSSDNNSDDNNTPSVTYSTYSDDSERTKSSAKESADVTTMPNNESESKQTTTVATKETNKETTAVTSVTSDKKTTVTEETVSTTSEEPEEEPKEKPEEEPESEQSKVEKKVQEYIDAYYTKTEIDSITVNEDLGTDVDGDYIALVRLTWNVSNSAALSKEVLDIYSSDMATRMYKDLPEIQELAVFWTVPHLNNGSAKISFERKDDGMYYTDTVFDSNFD